MKYSLSIILLCFAIQAIGQIKGKVLNVTTNQPIPYTNIWVKYQNTGTTSDENGNFSFENISDTSLLIFSALSFEKQTIKVRDFNGIIELKPIAIELETVTISPPKSQQQIKTGKVKKRDVSVWYCSGNRPYRMGKIFHYKEDYKKTPFINTIEFVANTHKINRKVLIHVYEVGEGTPENWNILAQNIECNVRKGDKINTLDLTSHQIKMSKSGVMIVIESLIIDSNFYEFEIKNSQTGQMMTIRRFEPCFGTIPTETTETTWVYRGKWTQQQHKQSASSPKKYINKYTELAMELILSN
ncbi:MAG: carboxypeptidase-like regulatory domain-containing protein [Saprospiraceae bacterium]